MEPTVKQFLIDEQLAQAILNYLANRRYKKVYMLVAAIQQLQPAPQDEPHPKAPKTIK